MATKVKPHTTVTVAALPTCDFCGQPAHADGACRRQDPDGSVGKHV